MNRDEAGPTRFDDIGRMVVHAARRQGNEQEVVRILTENPAALQELRTLLSALWGAGDPDDVLRLRAALSAEAEAVLLASGIGRFAESARTRPAPGGGTFVR